MYNLKIVKGNKEELIPSVQSITITHLVSEKQTKDINEVLEDIGIMLVLKLTSTVGLCIALPDRSVLPQVDEDLHVTQWAIDRNNAIEADIVYVTNEHGVTVDSYRWPPRKKT